MMSRSPGGTASSPSTRELIAIKPLHPHPAATPSPLGLGAFGASGRAQPPRQALRKPPAARYLPGPAKSQRPSGAPPTPAVSYAPNVVGAGSVGRPQGTPKVLASGRCWASPPPLTEPSLSLRAPPLGSQSVRRLPRGVRAGAASPAEPPSVRAAPSRGQIRCEPPLPPPPCLLLPHGVPPTEARLVFPGSGLRERLAKELPASGLPSDAFARQTQRWHRPDLR